jgi:DNA-directed RNA polymerase subunit RPC12/RpoP
MHKSQVITKGIFHPRCADCGAHMWHSRIDPRTSDRHERTFECPRCGNVAVRVVSASRPDRPAEVATSQIHKIIS